jgi:hypothetical protein
MTRDRWDHTENGLWVKCIMKIKSTRGIQWGKAQIRVWEGGQVHEKICLLKNDRYKCNKGEEGNPTG